MGRRSEQLRDVATNLIKSHDEWVNDPNRENPDEAYWDEVSVTIDAFEQGDIPADIRPLAEAVSKFADEADAFEDRENDNDVHPRDGFWRALETIRETLAGPTRRDLPPLESIAELAKLPYMQHVQIAQMYGFIDRRGNPMPALVQQELQTPGSVLNTPKSVDGRDWKDPRLADIDQQDNKAAEVSEAIREKGRRSRKETAPCKETARELWEQGVSPAQAAMMLKEDERIVAKQFAGWTAYREFSGKVWELVDKAVPLPEICKRLKADPKKVEAAIRDRPMVGAGVGDAGDGVGTGDDADDGQGNNN